MDMVKKLQESAVMDQRGCISVHTPEQAKFFETPKTQSQVTRSVFYEMMDPNSPAYRELVRERAHY